VVLSSRPHSGEPPHYKIQQEETETYYKALEAVYRLVIKDGWEIDLVPEEPEKKKEP